MASGGDRGVEVETLSGYVYPAKLPIGLGMDLQKAIDIASVRV